MKTIDISTPRIPNAFVIVDDADFDWLNQWKWHKSDKGYAARNQRESGKQRVIKMHRAILQVASGLVVDHINGNRLDNRRDNLRLCTHVENARNRKKNKSKSAYKGVHQLPSGRFQAKIRIGSRQVHLGCFDADSDAATAYNMAASKCHGEFARMNPV